MTGLLAALVLCAIPTPACAQASALGDLNLPYLHYFGFGAFWIGDQRVWTLRGRVTPSLIDHRPRTVGLALRLSGSVSGIQGRDLVEEIQNVGVATAAVGGEVRVNLDSRSLLRLYGDVGAAFELDSDREAALLAVGGLWERVFPWKGMEVGVQPSVDLVASASSARDLDDRIVALQLKADLRRSLGFHIWGSRAQAGVYVDLAHFEGDTDLSAATTETAFADNQIELGVTFGTHPRPRIVLFRPLLNLGVRWGRDFRGIRIGLGDRMTRLPPVP